MNHFNALRFLLCSLASVAAFEAHAYPGESIVLDPSTGDYIVTYWDEEEPASLEKGIFTPSTKISPSVQSRFRMNGNGSVSYRYKVGSSSSSRQIIGTVRFEFTQSIIGSQEWPKVNREAITEAQLAAVYDANMAALATPDSWEGSIYSNNGYRISWHPSHDPETGIRPGTTIDGFGFISQALPGVGMAQLAGERPPRGWSGHGPTEKSAIRPELDRLENNDFVLRNAAVPTIAVPVPFDAAVLLDRIRNHVATWTSKQLLDPALATQLDRYLVSAADAYRRNQLKAGKEHIETLREMLKREHKDLDHDDDENENGKRAEKNDDHRAVNQRILIDRLAARILDFDLKYVLKRTEREDDDHKKH